MFFIPRKNGVDLPLDPLLVKFLIPALFALPVTYANLCRNLESLIEHFLQKPHDMIPFSLGDDRIHQFQTHSLFSLETNLRLIEHICRKHAVLTKFLQNTLPILFHQSLRRILFRKRILFFDPDRNTRCAEKLFLDPLFHPMDLFFLDHMMTEYMYMKKITAGIGRDLLYFHIPKQKSQLFLCFQCRKYFKKCLDCSCYFSQLISS